MAKIETEFCPECREAFDFPEAQPVDRRNFLQAAAVGTAATLTGVAAAADSEKPQPRKVQPAEELIKELFSTLSDDQKKKLVQDYDDGAGNNRIPTRKGMYNGPIKGIRIGDSYTKAQQDLVERIVKSLSSGDEGYRQISRGGKWDNSGSFDRCGALFFGEPVDGKKFAFVFAGHHLTIRCDGNSEEGPAFGGPIYYGHSPNGWSRGNIFNYQSRAVVKLYEALSGKQQELATVKKGTPGEQARSVQFREASARPGIPAGELSKDQLALAEEVMRTVLSPYRKEDADEVMDIIKKNGGMEKIQFAFFVEGSGDKSEPWSFWRLEGPGFVWNYRVLPHVHTFVNISSKLV